jgi:hypothetical protein
MASPPKNENAFIARANLALSERRPGSRWFRRFDSAAAVKIKEGRQNESG